jgi:hypothetical protein
MGFSNRQRKLAKQRNADSKLVSESTELSQDSPRIIHLVEVEEFISNPDNLPDGFEVFLEGGERQVQNIAQANRMPRGSIIGTIVSDGSAKFNSRPVVLFPFFSSHFCLPVKTNEQVWAIFERSGNPTGVGFWLTRRSGPKFVEDLNCTHMDRTADIRSSNQLPSTYQMWSGIDPNSAAPNFTAGGGADNSATTRPGPENQYNLSVERSTSYSQFTGEPVAKFSQRCSDFVIQGSNNARIILTEDRPGAVNENDPAVKGQGTIDIVVGVGQTDSTSPVGVIENTRGYEENKKISETQNPAEGDPDFFNDLSRIYVSMSTSGDDNFSTTGITSLSTANANTIAPGGTGPITSTSDKEGPFIVAKSKNVRVVSHNKDEIGTIRIVQCNTNGSENASIVIDENGVIQIHGSGIVMGDSSANQPYIKYDQFQALMTFLQTQMAAHATGISAYGKICAAIPVLGPMLGGGPFSAIGDGVITSLATTPGLISSCASNKIFGQ